MSKLISLPSEYNYVAAFLTLACNFRCSYCINRPDNSCTQRDHYPAKNWLQFLNRLSLPDDLPITLQGGEPSQHPEFLEIIQGIRPDLHVDLLTNLSFDVEAFAREIPPSRFARESPYPAIRVTYHPGQCPLEEVLEKVRYMQTRGYSIGLYSIRAPGHERIIENISAKAQVLGIEYRTKEFLGRWRDQIWGTYGYTDGVFSSQRRHVQCRTSELLIAPDGHVFRCHRDLYLGEHAIGHIETVNNGLHSFTFRDCDKFGECNPCDLKSKTNRFQVDGHCSVEIRFIEDQPR